MLLGKNSELTGDGVVPQWASPPLRPFVPLGDFALSKTWSENNRYYLPPLKEIPGRKPVCHEIMLQKIFDLFIWENSARLNDGGGGGRLA